MADERVAVIAVHGVADQQPGETNRAIANLLLNIDEGKTAAYAAFATRSVQIPVRRIEVEPRKREPYAKKDFATYAADRRTGPAESAAAVSDDSPAQADAGIAFMASLTANYEPSGPDETYATTVLTGKRQSHGASPARSVDVYEMYWADLSRLTQSWLRMFAEIYQLLFHLASLGVHAINAGMTREVRVGKPRTWKWFARSQRGAANMLVRHIFALNLWLLALLLALSATLASDAVTRIIAWASYAVLAVMAVAVVTYQSHERKGSIGLALVLSLVVVTGFALAFVQLGAASGSVSRRALATLLVVAVAAAVVLILKAYDRHRPGTAKAGLLVGVPLVGFVLFNLWRRPTDGKDVAQIVSAIVHGGEAVYAALAICWVIFLACAWTAHVTGASIVRQARALDPPDGEAVARITRLNWTARLTLSLPAVLFLLSTLSLWTALGKAMPDIVATVDHRPLWVTAVQLGPDMPSAPVQVGALVTALTRHALGPGLVVLAVLVAAALFIVLFAVAPSVIAEVRAPSTPRDGNRSGVWLDGGFNAARWAGRGVVFGVLVVLPGFLVTGVILRWLGSDFYPWLRDANGAVLAVIGMTLGAGSAGLVMFGNRLKQVTLGLRGLLDVLLDVDNYLRENPRSSTPRARIITRMASLLRYVYAQGYDRVVIVAHSQGTVIAADLLRFIHTLEGVLDDPQLLAHRGKPLYLFTMGSPLRQLYALRFPHLYEWARHSVPGPWTDRTSSISNTTAPDPAALGVAQWVNAYRSGDYIGRYLWRPEVCDFAFHTPPVDARTPWVAGPFPETASATSEGCSRREFCIGSGGHTHYWDATAPQIALELDRLIREDVAVALADPVTAVA